SARFGTITGLVNNAGVYEPAPIATTTPEQIRRTIDANVFSFFVVNVSSAMTRVPFPHRTTYTASKWAMDAYTRALAVELVIMGTSSSLITVQGYEPKLRFTLPSPPLRWRPSSRFAANR
ncbi:hypothetical protein DFJ73DRAFT_786792, partial [Zopfochytrium polystomum]